MEHSTCNYGPQVTTRCCGIPAGVGTALMSSWREEGAVLKTPIKKGSFDVTHVYGVPGAEFPRIIMGENRRRTWAQRKRRTSSKRMQLATMNRRSGKAFGRS